MSAIATNGVVQGEPFFSFEHNLRSQGQFAEKLMETLGGFRSGQEAGYGMVLL